MIRILALIAFAALAIGSTYAGAPVQQPMSVVPVDNALVDGSCWRLAYDRLWGDGYKVLVLPTPAVKVGVGIATVPVLPPRRGYVTVEAAGPAAFAAAVDPATARFMAASRVSWGVAATSGAVGPAWRSKPSYFLLTTDNRLIQAAQNRVMPEQSRSRITDANSSRAMTMYGSDDVEQPVDTDVATAD